MCLQTCAANQACWHTLLGPATLSSAAGHYGPLLAKRILDYNAWAKKANQKGDQQQHLIINLGGLAMGNAWTDAYHDNTATLDFWCVCKHKSNESGHTTAPACVLHFLAGPCTPA